MPRWSEILLGFLLAILGWLTPIHAISPAPSTEIIQTLEIPKSQTQATLTHLEAYRPNGPPTSNPGVHRGIWVVVFVVTREGDTPSAVVVQYAYAGGDPVNNWDPSGLDYWLWDDGNWKPIKTTPDEDKRNPEMAGYLPPRPSTPPEGTFVNNKLMGKDIDGKYRFTPFSFALQFNTYDSGEGKNVVSLSPMIGSILDFRPAMGRMSETEIKLERKKWDRIRELMSEINSTPNTRIAVRGCVDNKGINDALKNTDRIIYFGHGLPSKDAINTNSGLMTSDAILDNNMKCQMLLSAQPIDFRFSRQRNVGIDLITCYGKNIEESLSERFKKEGRTNLNLWSPDKSKDNALTVSDGKDILIQRLEMFLKNANGKKETSILALLCGPDSTNRYITPEWAEKEKKRVEFLFNKGAKYFINNNFPTQDETVPMYYGPFLVFDPQNRYNTIDVLQKQYDELIKGR